MTTTPTTSSHSARSPLRLHSSQLRIQDGIGRIGILLLKRDHRLLIAMNDVARDLLAVGDNLDLPCPYDQILPAGLAAAIDPCAPAAAEIDHRGRRLRLDPPLGGASPEGLLLYTLLDLSRWQEIEAELEASRQFALDLNAIFEEAFDVIYVSDGQGNTLRVSSACERLWGLKEEELVGRNVRDLEREGVFKPSITRMVLEEKRRITSFQTTRNGRRLYVVGTPIFDDDGNIIRVVNASRDVTELEMLQKELEILKSLLQHYQSELEQLRPKEEDDQMVIHSERMKQLLSLVCRIAPVDTTVLLTGESGVGKDLIARKIHRLSGRREGPFVKINCAAIPADLLESELFGYEKGAFTGARSGGKLGLIELANTGTLFLDEIGELPRQLQVKLLQVIQEREFRRIGGTKPIKADIRILAATNQDLANLVRQGVFREDLFFRLNVINVVIPPLRERKEDIVPLTQHFLRRFNRLYHQNKRFLPEVFEAFLAYSWPGNVRELENTVERLVVTSRDAAVGGNDLPEEIFATALPTEPIRIDIAAILPLKDAVAILERKLLEKAFRSHCTTTATAKALKLSQATVSRKLRRFGIRPSR